MREMFSKAGFTTNEGGPFGVKRDPSRILALFTGTAATWADVAIIVPAGTSLPDFASHNVTFERTNGVERPIVTSTNEIDIFSAIWLMVFPKIGIKPTMGTGAGWQNINGYEFFIPIKGQL
jgi:hypothetical protein